MAQETFKAAQTRILTQLVALGWKTVPALKVSHATSPDGQTRLWFKPQAVYYSTGPKHNLGDARSLHADIRESKSNDLIFLATT